jgi:hypothetical protein
VKLETLKWLRIIAPGVIIVVLWWILGALTDLWGFTVPRKIDELMKDVIPIGLGGVYYLTPAREVSNQHFFKDVNNHLRSRLVTISGLPDAPAYTWQNLRGVFYSIVDSDSSLKVKSGLAYFNGFFWTTIADLRAISGVFLIISLTMYMLNAKDAILAVISFSTVFLLTIPLSFGVTQKQKSIGEEQIEIIQLNHLDILREKMVSIASR